MRSKILMVLAVCFIVGLCAQPALSQEQKLEPQLNIVWEVVVHPSKSLQYEEAMMEFVALASSQNFPLSWQASRTDDFHYFFVMPIEKVGDFDNVMKAFSGIAEKAGEKYAAINKKFAGTFESETFGMVNIRLDLSYIPENPRLTIADEDANFIVWDYYYIKTGMVEEAYKLAKEWKTMNQNIGDPNADYFYEGVMWKDMPALVIVSIAKNAVDYYTHSAKRIEKLGDQYPPFARRVMEACRSVETKTGMPLRDLSYAPKEK